MGPGEGAAGVRGRSPRLETMATRSIAAARTTLDRLYTEFDGLPGVLDPVHAVRRYRDPADLEVAAFCAAGLAFGRVASVVDSVETLLRVMGPSPATFVRRFRPGRDDADVREIRHRWIGGDDLVALLWILRHMLEAAGSIEGFFERGHREDASDVGPALDACSAARRVPSTLRPPMVGRGSHAA